MILIIELGQRNSSFMIGNCLYGEHCYGFPSLEIITIGFGYWIGPEKQFFVNLELFIWGALLWLPFYGSVYFLWQFCHLVMGSICHGIIQMSLGVGWPRRLLSVSQDVIVVVILLVSTLAMYNSPGTFEYQCVEVQ